MSKESLVQRLIAFLKKPDALQYDQAAPAQNAYDDYAPEYAAEQAAASGAGPAAAVQEAPASLLVRERPSNGSGTGAASRLDALIMRALQQFNAQVGCIIRQDYDGQMYFVTGRDYQGRYCDAAAVQPDRRAIFLALDSGESQLFVQTYDDAPLAVLCGPLWVENDIIGVLYLDNPARNRLHRGVFDVFCDQAARLLDAAP